MDCCIASKTVQHVVIVENLEPASPSAGFGKAGGGETPMYKFEVERKANETKIIGPKNNKIKSLEIGASLPEGVTSKGQEDSRTVKV